MPHTNLIVIGYKQKQTDEDPRFFVARLMQENSRFILEDHISANTVYPVNKKEAKSLLDQLKLEEVVFSEENQLKPIALDRNNFSAFNAKANIQVADELQLN